MSDTDHSELDQALAKRIRDSVDEHAVPDDIKRKLRLARAEAVASVGSRSPLSQTLFGNGRWLIPAGGAAVLAFAMITSQNTTLDALPVMDEQELAAAADMEMLDDIEFIAWMLEVQSDGSEPDDG